MFVDVRNLLINCLQLNAISSAEVLLLNEFPYGVGQEKKKDRVKCYSEAHNNWNYFICGLHLKVRRFTEGETYQRDLNSKCKEFSSLNPDSNCQNVTLLVDTVGKMVSIKPARFRPVLPQM